eukprot:TRINITY_DN7230_c1_g2_i1.p1 TRINITY_DN7230_c1_g2~~TRINITY_DN7230_c1_g2_i1.p1  ORF type:complete len:385 (+),score=163.35 TRINITY_DN7230_c1_g2_i1:195-1349(+)
MSDKKSSKKPSKSQKQQDKELGALKAELANDLGFDMKAANGKSSKSKPSRRKEKEEIDEGPKTESFACCVVGDKGCGKTEFLKTFSKQFRPDAVRYPNSKFESFGVDGYVEGETTYNVTMWDTQSDDQFSRYRALNYEESDVFIIMFSVVDNLSFVHASSQWWSELQFVCPDVPILLVGSKKDARSQFNQNHVFEEQGKELAAEIRAADYMEVSMNDVDSVAQVFKVVTELYKKRKELIQSENYQPEKKKKSKFRWFGKKDKKDKDEDEDENSRRFSSNPSAQIQELLKAGGDLGSLSGSEEIRKEKAKLEEEKRKLVEMYRQAEEEIAEWREMEEHLIRRAKASLEKERRILAEERRRIDLENAKLDRYFAKIASILEGTDDD